MAANECCSFEIRVFYKMRLFGEIIDFILFKQILVSIKKTKVKTVLRWTNGLKNLDEAISPINCIVLFCLAGGSLHKCEDRADVGGCSIFLKNINLALNSMSY